MAHKHTRERAPHRLGAKRFTQQSISFTLEIDDEE